jgi:tripeptide aminopeptidase
VLTYENSPYLKERIGDDIVTASGTTLLGADDKAGVAIVMAAARHLLNHPDIPHGPIRIGFTPDEEIGRGVHANLPADLGATFGYTLDGAHRGELVYETFSADGPSSTSRAFPSIPAGPRTSWSTRSIWRPRSWTRCPRRR